MSKKLHVVVFGGSGFVGSHVADVLSESGHIVTVFDIRPSPYIRVDQSMVIGDIHDVMAIEKVIEGADIVYNLAGIADIDEASRKPVETVKQNILANILLMQACNKAKVQRFIYASTIYVYSEQGGFYRCSKQASELYIEEFCRQFNLNFTILRYGTLYGPRANMKNSIYNYLSQALTNHKVIVAGTGDERREYIHVRDAARLSLQILENKFANMHVTLTGHQSIRFRDMLYMIKEIMQNKITIEFAGSDDGPHYSMTPYSYIPKAGYKLTSNRFVDLGQGLLECLAEVDAQSTSK